MFESHAARDRLQLCAFLVIVIVWFAVLVLCGINVHHGNDRASETNEYGDGIVVQRTACEEESNDEKTCPSKAKGDVPGSEEIEAKVSPSPKNAELERRYHHTGHTGQNIGTNSTGRRTKCRGVQAAGVPCPGNK